jgi:hypothetical protein
LEALQLEGELLELGWFLGSNGVGISLGLGVFELFLLELGFALFDLLLVLFNFFLDVLDVLGNDVLLVGKSLGGSCALDSLSLGFFGDLHDGAGNISDT